MLGAFEKETLEVERWRRVKLWPNYSKCQSNKEKKRKKNKMDKHSLWITFSISIPDIVSNWHFYLLESQCKTKKTVSLSLPQLIICGQSLLTLICSLQKRKKQFLYLCTKSSLSASCCLLLFHFENVKLGTKVWLLFLFRAFFTKKEKLPPPPSSHLNGYLLVTFCVILLWRGSLIHRFSSPYENFSWIVLKHEFETV